MKNIRIGNDIIVAWSILREGEPFSLEGLDISLYLKNDYGSKKQDSFSVHDNVLYWTFYGKDQRRTGKYSLEIIINEDRISMVTTDVCNFVNLVPCDCLVGGSDDKNVHTETIDITSHLDMVNVTVDDELSETSENAIANKVVTIALNERPTREELIPEFAKKVDKEEGKVLSSNDYTDEEKAKLERLENYDDSAIRHELDSKLSKEQAADGFDKVNNEVVALKNMISTIPFFTNNLIGMAYVDFARLG